MLIPNPDAPLKQDFTGMTPDKIIKLGQDTKLNSNEELTFYCECGQAVKLRKKDTTWVHYGYNKIHEPFFEYLKRTDHPVKVKSFTIWRKGG